MNETFTLKWYSAILAYTTGPVCMVGPTALSVYLSFINPNEGLVSYPIYIRILTTSFGILLSSFFYLSYARQYKKSLYRK